VCTLRSVIIDGALVWLSQADGLKCPWTMI